MIIPDEIGNKEIIIRGVFHPLQYSHKHGVKQSIFYPPPGQNEVSVLRRCYASKHQCIEYLKTKVKMDYVGFLYFQVQAFMETRLQVEENVDIKSSPLEDAEFHAGILYEKFRNIRGVGVPVPTKIKQFAKDMISKSKLYLDNYNIPAN